MRLKVNNVRVSLLEETSVKEAAAKKLGLKKQDIDNLQIVLSVCIVITESGTSFVF